MTRTKFTLLSVALACTLSACDGGHVEKTEAAVQRPAIVPPPAAPKPAPAPDSPPPPSGPDSPDGKVQLAAVVAREISRAPEQADEILGKHGLDRDKLDQMIFEIAADPALTKAYMAARRAQ